MKQSMKHSGLKFCNFKFLVLKLLMPCIFLNLIYSIEASASGVCNSVFAEVLNLPEFSRLQSKSQDKLKSVITKEVEEEGISLFEVQIVKVSDGIQLGISDITIQNSVNKLTVLYTKVAPSFRQMGVSDALLELAVNIYPNIETIQAGSLRDVNLKICNQFLKRGFSKIDAIKQTPAYKSRAKLGFTEIVPGSITEGFGFSVKKPNP